MIIAAALLMAAAVAVPVNDREIKATTPARVKSIRTALIERIWGVSWTRVMKEQPRVVEHNYERRASDALPQKVDNLRSITRIEVGSPTLPSNVFIFYPVQKARKALIVHQGHSCDLDRSGDRPDDNVGLLIERAVASGYIAAGMRMPLFQDPTNCGHYKHDSFFEHPPQRGSALEYFLDPVARTVNYLIRSQPDLEEIDMAGLSGGGWTTTLYAAVDQRVVKSFPVAGSVPLYMRDAKYNHDREQYDPSIYNIAGYKDLYVLGSYGPGRRQQQILNRYDDCCFGEKQHKVVGSDYIEAVRNYEREVQATLAKLGAGTFAVDIDESAHTHQIPEAAIERVILPGVRADGAEGAK